MIIIPGNKSPRIVLAKIGLDGHDRGVKVIARALRDAGMEVIYLGMRISTEEIVQTVLQEDANALGISILSGAHMRLVPKLIRSLQKYNLFGRVILMVGGTIPENDVQLLEDMGVHGVFPVGTFTETVVDFVRGKVKTQ